jgi:PAS domain S-box-containing protein
VTGTDLKFKYISPSIFNFLGYTDEEAFKLECIQNIMIEDSYKILKEIQNEIFDLAELDKMKDKIIQKKFECGLIHKNSSVIPSDILLTITFDKSGIPIDTIAICKDITKKRNYQKKISELNAEVKNIKNKLSQNKKLFDIINQNTFDIIFCSDSEMTFTYVSDSVESFIGYSPEYIIGKQMSFFATEESNKAIMEIFNELLDYQGKPQYSNAEIVKRIEIQLIKKNNIPVWTETVATVIFNENAIISDIIGITRDIDERKKNEVLLTQTKEKLQSALKKLSESERKYKYLVTNSSDVFWTMTPDLKLTYVSPKVFDLQGLTQEEAINLPFEKKFPHESMQIFMGMAHEILSLQGNPDSRNQYYNKTYQLPQYHKDGHIIMTEISLTVIFDENAMAKEAIGVTRDISARIAYQKEIERINKELKIANDELKTLDEMKTNLLSNVSHELRTPLASIKGYISMLSSGASGPLNTKQDKYVNIVQKNIEHLISLIETLLSYSRLDLGEKGLKLSDFNLIELIEEIFDTVNSKNKFRNPLKLNTFCDKIFIFADYRQIKQVFINLIDNAIKFSAKDSPIEIIIKDNAKNIDIEVKDNGIGIPKEKVDIIFDRFYQIDSSTTRHFQGMGLGLSIVKRILDLHDSDVSVKSLENNGTSFYFKLKKGNSVTTESEDISTDKNNLIKIREQKYEISPILVVDDQIEMLNFLEELFNEANLPVHVINNSKEVTDYINNNKISLAILDISMADINGLEICHIIKQKHPQIPVIMLSAFSEEKYRELAKEALADDYIVKPFDINQLLEKVREHITK